MSGGFILVIGAVLVWLVATGKWSNILAAVRGT